MSDFKFYCVLLAGLILNGICATILFMVQCLLNIANTIITHVGRLYNWSMDGLNSVITKRS